jgi:hypothetical protein
VFCVSLAASIPWQTNPLDFERVPKSTVFGTNQNKMRKMRIDAKMGGLKL